jgi:hypothetical protein
MVSTPIGKPPQLQQPHAVSQADLPESRMSTRQQHKSCHKRSKNRSEAASKLATEHINSAPIWATHAFLPSRLVRQTGAQSPLPAVVQAVQGAPLRRQSRQIIVSSWKEGNPNLPKSIANHTFKHYIPHKTSATVASRMWRRSKTLDPNGLW